MKDKITYKEIVRAVRTGKARDFARNGPRSYPDTFFTVGNLRVCIYKPGKSVSISTQLKSTDGYDFDFIWCTSFRLRLALRRHNRADYERYYKGVYSEKLPSNYVNLIREVEDAK